MWDEKIHIEGSRVATNHFGVNVFQINQCIILNVFSFSQQRIFQ